jgi:hypothetical protein
VSDSSNEPSPPPSSDRHQLLAAIILGVAAVLTALASYNSSSAGGDASNLRTDAGRTLTDANFFYSQANQTSAGDQSLFVAYASAIQQDDGDLADYLTTLMRPEMQAAVEWWGASDEAVTPFDELEDNPYELSDLDEANALETTAAQQLEDSETSDDKAAKFDLATVLLALTLFFAGVATLFSRSFVTRILLLVGGVTLVVGTGVFVQGVTA